MKTKLYNIEAIEYIAKLADGGLRDAVTMMDKCLSFSEELTLENVIKALGTVDYEIMKNLTESILSDYSTHAIEYIEGIHSSGKDIKQFLSQYVQFLLDIQKYDIMNSFKYLQLPATKDNQEWLDNLSVEDYEKCEQLLRIMLHLNSNIKWSQTAKYDLEAEVLMFMLEEKK